MCSNNERPGLPEVKWEKIELTNVRDIGGGVKVGLYNGAPVVIHPEASVWRALSAGPPPEVGTWVLLYGESFGEPRVQSAFWGDDGEWYDSEAASRPVTAFGWSPTHWAHLKIPVDSTDQP